MNYKILFVLLFSISTRVFGQLPFGNFKIMEGNDCGIEFGRIQTAKTINNKFRFRIDINNKAGYTGAVDGYALIVSKNKAIFRKKDCSSITFTFLPGNIIKIKESNCSTYHGANICFDGSYQQYLHK